MTVNGQPYQPDALLSVRELLDHFGFDHQRVAVLLNGRVVVREDFGRTEVGGQDALEVVAFVGGG